VLFMSALMLIISFDTALQSFEAWRQSRAHHPAHQSATP
jgi:heme-degrading monooxygenase HmoA